MYNIQTVSERIKLDARQQGIKLKEMLESCGLNVNFIIQMSDRTGAFFLAKIADYLNCSVDYLLGRTDTPDLNVTYTNGDNSIQAVVGGAIEHNTVTIAPTDEMTKEIALLLSGLTYRQKTELMKEIYDFVDNTKKGGE